MTRLEMAGRKRFADVSIHACDEIVPLIVRMQTEDAKPLDASEFVLVLEHVRTCRDCQQKIVLK
jgi:hypothetical protein